MTTEVKMRMAVIVSDAVHMVNAGGELERTVRMFDLPDEIAAYIRKQRANSGYVSISLALDDSNDR